MATRATTNIVKRNYKAMYRDPDTVAAPADAAAWSTLLATFTDFGYFRKSSLEVAITKGDIEELDDGSELTLGYNLDLKFDVLQTGASEITELDGIDGEAQDVMLVDLTANRAVVYANVIVNIGETLGGTGADAFNVEITKKNASSKGAIRTMFDIPTS